MVWAAEMVRLVYDEKIYSSKASLRDAVFKMRLNVKLKIVNDCIFTSVLLRLGVLFPGLPFETGQLTAISLGGRLCGSGRLDKILAFIVIAKTYC